MRIAKQLKYCMEEVAKKNIYYYSKDWIELAIYNPSENTLYYNEDIFTGGKPVRMKNAYYEIKKLHSDAKVSAFFNIRLGGII